MEEQDALLKLQKHFEAQFGNVEGILPVQVQSSNEQSENDNEGSDEENQEESEQNFSEEEEWTPFSSSSSIVRISHQEKEKPIVLSAPGKSSFFKKMPKLETEEDLKIKRKNELLRRKSSRGEEKDETPENEAEDLKNDIELQKLLRESHLLHEASSRTGETNLVAHGKIRQKVIQQHIKELGGKEKEQKMPMAARRGMAQKRKHVDRIIEKEARESGTVLAKKAKQPKKQKKGFVPGTFSLPGKFVGGTLRLPKNMAP
ncbi:rRNA processing protein Faf1 [Schizosaccharomyces cryophilus OY26]|uniref:rRNA processing protein Faf1 n=1 Tax=Schizosaccharomyces cryophilus (strain OY26 / ATCC MYA-4695 / CBS 11777 / NBRC 106824 / NRRL Y48691) TaxID=653667 RepID=S9W5I9_SCHCR|nr:rRNA processing protein Faf1 [Schizosaccharomyces cryophilus OY26]EPY53250.1 rRNA processing protein Faf1 [Schizosaccharomyces cryophilus OY26]